MRSLELGIDPGLGFFAGEEVFVIGAERSDVSYSAFTVLASARANANHFGILTNPASIRSSVIVISAVEHGM
jgi:hypothetical protein